MAELKKTFPPGVDYLDIYDPEYFCQPVDSRSRSHGRHRNLARDRRCVLVPSKLASDDYSGHRHSGLSDWRIHDPESLRRLNQQSVAVPIGLAVGLVVDDAIVVVENVERNMTLGFAA